MRWAVFLHAAAIACLGLLRPELEPDRDLFTVSSTLAILVELLVAAAWWAFAPAPGDPVTTP